MVIVSSRSKRRVYAPIGTTGRLARIYPIRLSCFARPCAVRKLELAFPRALRLRRQHQLADRLRRLHPAGIGIRSSTRATTVTYLGATRALPLQPRNVRRGSLAADPLSGSATRGRLVKPRGVRKFTAFDGQQRLGTPAAAPIMARRLIAMNIRLDRRASGAPEIFGPSSVWCPRPRPRSECGRAQVYVPARGVDVYGGPAGCMVPRQTWMPFFFSLLQCQRADRLGIANLAAARARSAPRLLVHGAVANSATHLPLLLGLTANKVLFLRPDTIALPPTTSSGTRP